MSVHAPDANCVWILCLVYQPHSCCEADGGTIVSTAYVSFHIIRLFPGVHGVDGSEIRVIQ